MITVIICTYNRPLKVSELLTLLLAQTLSPIEIIVVDSSDVENLELKYNSKVIYLRSSHKNQPYQRYLGYLKSSSEYLLFLDDDMEPINSETISIISNVIHDRPGLVGIALNFKDKFSDSSLSRIPKTLFPTTGKISALLRSLTGYITLPSGKLGYCGLRGSQPQDGGYTEWISGGAFVAKRSELFKDFNFQLFYLFDQKLGMGEDVILGYTLSKRGMIYFLPHLLFWHNDLNDSSYSRDHKIFSQRVIYSRLYLSLEVARLGNKSQLFARIYFYWYTLWRIFGLISNLFISRERTNIKTNVLKGAFIGFIKSFSFKFNHGNRCKEYWINEISQDLIINESNFSK